MGMTEKKSMDGFLAGAGTVAIAGHVKPDGDCIGSCLAAYNYIKTYYPEISVDLYLEPIPNIFKFMARSDEILHGCSADRTYDLFLSLDCGDTGRLGDAAHYFSSARRTVCIDHHISNQGFAGENYVFPEKSSTSELIFELLPPECLTKEIAECIYTGIVHDTGLFQYSCTSPRTMEIAGELMGHGIDYTKIVNDTFFMKTYCQNRIMGLALIKSRLHLGGRCISTVITAAEMREYGALPKHLEGIVSQLSATKGVDAAVFLYETGEGEFKASLRSSDCVDVARIALAHGGGGHVRAAGFSEQGESEEILESIVDEISGQLM